MSCKLCWFILSVAAFSFGCLGEELPHGINHVQLKLSDGSVDAIIIDKDTASVKIVSTLSKANAEEYGFPLRAIMSISDYAIATNAIVVLSGGFLASFSPPTPLGAIIIHGSQVSPKHNSWLTTGVFCTSKSKRFVSNFELYTIPNIDCLQSGPLFIQNGKLRYDFQSKSSASLSTLEINFAKSIEQQSFICTTNDGKLVLAVSTEASLEELGRIAKSELACADALGLSGDGTVGLYYNGTIVGNNAEPLTSAVAVFLTQ